MILLAVEIDVLFVSPPSRGTSMSLDSSGSHEKNLRAVDVVIEFKPVRLTNHRDTIVKSDFVFTGASDEWPDRSNRNNTQILGKL